MDDLQRIQILEQALAPTTGGMGGGMPGMGGNPMSGYLNYLQSWASANPGNQRLGQMVAEQMMQYSNPYTQWQMQSEMQNRQWDNMFQMADMANMMMQSEDPWVRMRGEEMIRGLAGNFGPQQEQSFADMARSGFAKGAQEAAMSGNIEDFGKLSALAALDDRGIEMYSARPTQEERFAQVNRFGGIPGYALGGMAAGAGIGAGIGSVVPVVGTAVGGIAGGALGAGAGTVKALLDMFREEKIKEDRLRRSGYML